MSDEPESKKPGAGAREREEPADDDGEDRPTVTPPFDPVAFAKEVLGTKPSSPPDGASEGASASVPRMRPPSPTLTDPDELEAARQESIAKERRPSSELATTKKWRTTPGGALSLANQRVPSNLPPKIRKSAPRTAAAQPAAPAAPAPPPQPPPQPPRKESTASFAAVDKEWEELATAPPPPLQQELIDAMARGNEPPSTKEAPDSALEKVLSVERKVHEAERKAADDAPEIETSSPEQEMTDRMQLGDYTGALDVAEKLLLLDPFHTDALKCAEQCRGVLKQMYTAKIGSLDRVPTVMVPRDQLRWLSIDHRAGFVLSLVDGVSSLEMILDVTGMPELDALRILSELVQQRIIAFR